MIIPLTLNGKKVMLDTNPGEKLVDTLRRQKLVSVKKGCEQGCCGSCTVLLNGAPVPSCIIPVVLVKDCAVVTLEYFMHTDGYNDIQNGFAKAGIQLCGFCDAGKIFTAWDIMQNYSRPSHNDLKEAVSHLPWCCTDQDTYINGILYAIMYRNKRMGAAQNVRK